MSASSLPADPQLGFATHGPNKALMLSGGGARGAYHVGVLKAIAEWLPEDAPLPFEILCGTSVGSMLAAILATHANSFQQGVTTLDRVWSNFTIDQVLRVAPSEMFRVGIRALLALASGGFLMPPPRSLLDNSPLRALLERHVNFAKIRQWIALNRLHALSVTAANYQKVQSMAFYEGHDSIVDWAKEDRVGIRTDLELDHLMASGAVPLLFPSIHLSNESYGDGALRGHSPLSTPLKLGAQKILIITLRHPTHHDATQATGQDEPSVGHMMGFLLDSVFADNLQADLNQLNVINGWVEAGQAPEKRYQKVDTLVIGPQSDLGNSVGEYYDEMPLSLRVLFKTLGVGRTRGEALASFVLFDRSFTRTLISEGYKDAYAQREAIEKFLRD